MLSILRPPYPVALQLHQVDEMVTAPCHGHRVLNGDSQLQFPALPFVRGAIFSGRHGRCFAVLRLDHRQTVCCTNLVRYLPKLLKAFQIAVVLFPGINAHGVDNKVGVNMFPVRVGGYQDFKAGWLICHFQGNLMGCLGGEILFRFEGLNHMVEHSAIIFIVQPLGIHEFVIGSLCYAIHPRHQMPPLVGSFLFSAAVVNGSPQTAAGLGFRRGNEFNQRHHPTAFVSEFLRSAEIPVCTALSVPADRQPSLCPYWQGW